MNGEDDGPTMGASPYSTGGGGTVLEHRYGAMLLASLLARDPIPELGDDVTLVSVRFQASPVSAVDDLLVSGHDRDGGERRVSIGVRRAPALTASDSKSARLLESYVRMVADHWAEISAGRWRLCLAVASPNAAVQQVRELAGIARAAGSEAAFRAELRRARRTTREARKRLDHLDALAHEAATQAMIITSGINPGDLTWRVLWSLRLRELRLEGADKTDRTAAVVRLRQIIGDGTPSSASDLFARLAELAGQYAAEGADVTEQRLRLDLPQIVLAGPRSPGRVRVSADAMLRGPVAHLGLTQQLADADDRFETDPAAAAAGYGTVSDALADSPYAPHAARIRARQAEALRRAGDAAGAAAVDLARMAAALTSSDLSQVLVIADRIVGPMADQQQELPDRLVRAVGALAALAAYEHYPQMPLEQVAAQLDATEPGDPYRLLTAMLLAEHAIAAGRPDIVRTRTATIAAIVDTASPGDAGRLAAARLLACLADADGDWDRLARTAKAGYPPRVAALLLARHGRHLAITAQPQAAIERYNDAVEQACEAGAYADAADWQFTIRLIRISYGLDVMDGTLDDPYRLALALRTAGNDSVIPAPVSPLELALSDLLDDSLPDALAALRRYRRRAVTLGDWAGERQAEIRLGDLYAAAGEPMTASEHFITAGEADRLSELPRRLPEQTLPLKVPPGLAGMPAWERAAACSFAGAAADLLADSDAIDWAEATLAEVIQDAPAPVFTRNPALDACIAFAHLADATSHDQARRFLDHSDAWVERDPGHYKHTDAAHAEALVRIAAAHSPLRRVAVDQMCRALIADQRMGEIILSTGAAALRAEPGIVTAWCADKAAEGHMRAALAIILARADAAPATPIAKQMLDALTSPQEHTLGRTELAGGLPQAALLSVALDPADRARFADAMTAVAEDHAETGRYRREALAALAVAGPHLADDDQARIFPIVLLAARGDLDGSVDDGRYHDGPLERFRISIGTATLRYDGLLAAAVLAGTSEQYDATTDAAYELMPFAGPHQANRIADALTRLPTDGRARLDPVTLAAHGSEWVRAAAAAIWCTTGAHPVHLGSRLAADPSGNVRRSLAAHLPHEPEYEQLRATLASDIRRSVRAAARSGQ
jgi:hypothetical protein